MLVYLCTYGNAVNVYDYLRCILEIGNDIIDENININIDRKYLILYT